MELRTLKYFLAVAQEESISKAASDVLFVTQPTLSRQMQELEEELGVKLFERSNKKTILTENGIHFRKRAEEIVALAERTASEFKDASQQELTGDIFVGGGETDGMRVIAKVFKKFNEKHPQVRLNLFSGNAADVTEKLDQGLLDFGILIEPVNKQKYDYLALQSKDTWGLLVRRDSELAERKFIKPADLTKIPLIVSRQSFRSNEFSGWLGRIPLNVIATYNLLFNASLMVKEGVGCALCLDKIISTSEDSELKFIPLRPAREVGLVAVYKKNAAFSKPAALFLEMLKQELE